MTEAQILELRHQRAKLVKQGNDILDKAAAEKRDLTGEEEQQFNSIHVDVDKLGKDIERGERQLTANASIAGLPALAGNPPARSSDNPEEQRDAQNRAAFEAWVRHGMEGLNPEQRQLMAGRFRAETPAPLPQGTTAAVGGYTIIPQWAEAIENAMLAYGGGVLDPGVVTVRTTSSGSTLYLPTSNDTGEEGEMLAENTAAAQKEITYGQKAIPTFMFSSKIVLCSVQLLQDSSYPIEQDITAKLGERLGRVISGFLTTGTGVDQPEGIVAAATAGPTAASSTDLVYGELVDLEHSIDPAYRPGSMFMCHDSALKVLKKMKDDLNRPIWLPGVAVKEPDTILGYPYVVNQKMDSVAASKVPLIFGQLKKFITRKVNDLAMLRLTERYAEYLQVGFLAYMRAGGGLLDAGTHPIKKLTMKAAG